jgi:hypothetical protein
MGNSRHTDLFDFFKLSLDLTYKNICAKMGPALEAYAQLLQCSSLAVLLWCDDIGHRHQLLLRPAVAYAGQQHA